MVRIRKMLDECFGAVVVIEVEVVVEGRLARSPNEK
jgi:hypothetical protein